MRKIKCGVSVKIKAVRKLENAYRRALCVEEAAETIEKAWKLAAKSDKALKALKLAQSGEVAPMPRTARNMGKAGLQALASIGRVIARAVSAKLALTKAKISNAAKRAAKLVRKSLRTVVMAVVAVAMVPACTDRPDDRLSVYDYETSLVTSNAIDCLIPVHTVDIGTSVDLVMPFTAFPIYTAEGASTWVHPAQYFNGEVGEAVYSLPEFLKNDVSGDMGAAMMATKANFVPCTKVRDTTTNGGF